MSGSHELLDRLAEIGATVEPAGDRLVLRAGAMPIPARLVASIRQAKAEMLTTLTKTTRRLPSRERQPSWSAADWIARHHESLRFWGGFHPAEEAAAIAWAEMVNLWHKRHGAPVPLAICSGCRRPIGNSDALLMGDGARVHSGILDCLTAYGCRWRGAATRALIAIGLAPPGEST